MGFENTAGPAKGQAVALRVQADRSIFLNCKIQAYQDTLYAHSHRQFYRDCLISGTIDFIFGDAAAVFQNCILTVRRPQPQHGTAVFAQSRVRVEESTGFVSQNCSIVAVPALTNAIPKVRCALGRPWNAFSTTVIMESYIGGFIDPAGYIPMNGDIGIKTSSYFEFNNRGLGADTSKRVKWPGVKTISPVQAKAYTVEEFIHGREWLLRSYAVIPVNFGFYG
ncbi:hypothetical protein BHE74_00047749 [Ensete ventricosum]|nr:hypothetical protein BHE74_00047749 [Ensete ventricosum]RZS27237.1 hypothetical protein BHM03_00060672 [Ensete ventricosum]